VFPPSPPFLSPLSQPLPPRELRFSFIKASSSPVSHPNREPPQLSTPSPSTLPLFSLCLTRLSPSSPRETRQKWLTFYPVNFKAAVPLPLLLFRPSPLPCGVSANEELSSSPRASVLWQVPAPPSHPPLLNPKFVCLVALFLYPPG